MSSVIVAAGMWLLPRPALAQLALAASATGQYEYNSNVFDVQRGYVFPGTNIALTGDGYWSYGGLLSARYLWSRQTLFADASGSYERYDKLTQLDHHEYKLDTGWNGLIGRIWSGDLRVTRTSTMVPFLYVAQSSLSLTTEQREDGGLGVQFMPDWRLEANGFKRKVDWPLPGEPNLKLSETEGDTALKYGGQAALTSGVSVAYLTGSFSGAPTALNPDYHQVTGAFVAQYAGTGKSTFVGQIGYSRRTSTNGLDNVSGTTGRLDWTDNLTGKTSVDLSLVRAINSYITNTGAEIDNSAGVTFNWRATYKIDVVPGYTWSYDVLPGQGNQPIGSDRHDHLQIASLHVDYEALSWLAIKPYVEYQERTSNLLGGSFSAATYGVSFTIQWQNRANQGMQPVPPP